MKRKLKTSTIILIVVCIVGLCALLYPTVANYWNENFTTKAVTSYVQTLNSVSEDEYKKVWNEAIRYNEELAGSGDGYAYHREHAEEYMKALTMEASGVMGYIEIPKINVLLPIYHTTSAEVLMTAVGHLEWTSLPTGGASTHCCLSGHRGLASAKLFTNLDQLREGDTFTLNILNETLTYEVDQIHTVLPTELTDLLIEDGMDYCTLITCTPYGINTHRLLVRGHRIQTDDEGARVVSEAVLIDELIVAMVLAIPILFVLVMMVMLKKPEKKSTDLLILSADQGSIHDNPKPPSA